MRPHCLLRSNTSQQSKRAKGEVMLPFLLSSTLVASTSALSPHAPPDPLSHPRFQVHISESYLYNSTANSLLSDGRAIWDWGDGHEPQVEDPHLMRTKSGQTFLCSVPVLSPPSVPQEDPTSATATTSDVDISPASLNNSLAAGLALLEPMRGHCLYYKSGWFTYSVCYGKQVRQFHEIRSPSNPLQPLEDPSNDIYVLGNFPPLPSSKPPSPPSSSSEKPSSSASSETGSAEVGEGEDEQTVSLAPFHSTALTSHALSAPSRRKAHYLLTHWTSGTICDMTSRPRRVQVEYHCSSSAPLVDRIVLIRELAICEYSIVVHTPKLCKEQAFGDVAKEDDRCLL
ncbi:hypothetical protein BT69DRAFT_887763 [Atractiella rhizophila]|nr:hypothetical protein BT69DRAFT_887763 [Atractiella rhizophila]